MNDVDNTPGVYHVSVTVTYEAFVTATSEATAKTKALDMDFEDMIMNDDVSVDVWGVSPTHPYLKTRPLSEILDEIESRISPEIRELEVRDGEIVRSVSIAGG